MTEDGGDGMLERAFGSSIANSDLATYESWVARRAPLNLSTNAGAPLIAFQGWRQFKEAFAPELVQSAIAETANALGRPVKACLDPFGGSGTTALTCQFLNVLPVTIEVNPFLFDLIAAKLGNYDFDTLPETLHRLTNPRQRTHFPRGAFPGAAPTFVQPGKDGRYIFPKDVAERVATILGRITRIDNLASRRLFRVMLASAAINVSNVVVSGKGRRYRRNWQQSLSDARDVDDIFVRNSLQAIYDLRRFKNRPQKKAKIIHGDARSMLSKSPIVDLAVFSPPYPNSFDYTDVYNVELWAGGYLQSSEDNRELRMRTIRSHVQIARDFSFGEPRSSALKKAMKRLRAKESELWNRHLPGMIGAYFEDMSCVLTRLHNRIVTGGRIYAVFGDISNASHSDSR